MTDHTCLAPNCLVSASLCTVGLCSVHRLAAELAVQHFTFAGATLRHLDPFQPSMAHEVREGIMDGECSVPTQGIPLDLQHRPN